MVKTLTRLADYRPYPFAVPKISLDVALDPERTVVRAMLDIEAKGDGDAVPDMVLDGTQLDLKSVRIDGRELASDEYTAAPDRLVIHHPPRRFQLETEVVINPSRNPAKKGLFWHSGVLATQCEAEGFRAITYFPDRPDVLTVYTVRLEAEREQFPTLLSNGEQCGAGSDGSRHWAVWKDPYAKPSYIFAMMAGRFDALRERIVIASGREVAVAIHAEPGEAKRCQFAMESLKAAFAWDERVFGLEYDLPVYNVVALPAYAGAQENKGLNLFGADGIIADPAITTDEEFSLIKRIIGHEYFHNWTGNRVTCRDWFQLSLKEGLTRLRDQLFMEDELEAGTFQIEQVKALRRNQFPEDDGPAAHPVQPTEFVEIENFYTTTIYEKGAEVLRMLRTMIGPEAFASAIRVYLAQFDGQAVTIEDLFDTIAAETGLDLTQFRKWLRQAGRPTVVADWNYDASQRKATLTLAQRAPDKPGPGGPMHIPVRIALIGEDGAMLGAPQLIHLTDWTQILEFCGLEVRPVPSILRQCSAPVTLECELPDDDLVLLALHDDDAFVAWNSAQQLFVRTVRALADHPLEAMARHVPPSIVTLAATLISDKSEVAPGLVAQMLSIPDEPALSEGLDRVRLDGHIAARQTIKRAIAVALKAEMTALYRELSTIDPADLSPRAISRRSLRSVLLDLLLASEEEEAAQLCLAQVRHGPSMTEKFEALCLISHVDHPERKAAFEAFYAAYQDQPLVVDKWFKAYALSRAPGVIDEIIALEGHPAFDIQNTARAAAYYGSLFRQNRVTFHDPTGRGYQFLADRLLMMDQMGRGRPAYFMPQLDQWRRYDEPRRSLMRSELRRVADTPGISPKLKEVVSRSLA